MLDRLLKISSLASGFLVFCGVFKLIIFFSSFNVQIVDFLSFSEIITSFLDDINLILIFGLIMALQSFMGVFVIKFIVKKTTNNLNYKNVLKEKMYDNRNIYRVFFSVALLLSFSLIYFKVITIGYSFIYLTAFFMLQLSYYLFIAKNEDGDIFFDDGLAALSSIITILTVVFLLAEKDINAVSRNEQEAVLYLQDSTILCCKKTELIYLGKTNEYTIFFNSKKNSSQVIPNSAIKKFEFSDKTAKGLKSAHVISETEINPNHQNH